MSNRGTLIVLSAPSGSGKTSLASEVLEQFPDLIFSVSHTTRKPRTGERDGTDYFFVSKREFERMIQEEAFLEYANVYGNYYGTSRAFVDEHLSAGTDVLLDIDVQGALQIKERKSDAVLIFLLPPSLQELESRLRNRGLDDEKIIAKRLQIAKREIQYYKEYQYVIINKELEKSVCELKSIILASHCTLRRRKERADQILRTFEET